MSDHYVHYLTTSETARALGVSRRTLARYKSNHKITPIRVNNKDMYSPDEVARFNASAESIVDKLHKQHLFNSARIVELEARIALLESALGLNTKRTQVNISDVDVTSMSNTLHYLCRLPLERWDIQTVEDLSGDTARLSDRLVKKLGNQLKTALELAYIHATRSGDARAKIAEAVSKVQLDRVTSVLG